MRINTNIASLQAQRQLSTIAKALSRSFARLASGSRLVDSSDSASRAIAVGLESQKRGLTRIIRSANEMVGLLNTADGAMSTQTEIVMRMRELALQAASGNLSSQERQYLDSELQSLYKEFNRITTDTDFNGVKLLDGSFSQRSIQLGTKKGESVSFSIGSMSAANIFRKSTGDGTFDSQNIVTAGVQAQYIEAADLDNDGNIDLISADSIAKTIGIMLGNGNGTFQTRKTLSSGGAGSFPTGVSVIDFNRDGIKDIVAADTGTHNVSVYLGTGGGNFQSRIGITTGQQPRSTTVGDLNNDGLIDILTPDNLGNTLSLLFGNGDGTFRSAVTLAAGANPKFAELGDINSDGRVDIVSTDNTNNTVSVFLGNGDGTYQARTTLATGSTPLEIRLVDLNNDNKLDIITGDSGGATLSVFLGNGNGTFQTRTTLGTNATPAGLQAVDLNGDGSLDLIESDHGTTTAGIFLGNGDGTFKARTTVATGTTPYHILANDFNNDGALDLVVTNYGTATIGLFLGHQQFVASSISIATQASAENMLDVFDNALQSIAQNRANIGAYQNRLDSSANVSSLMLENISTSLSQIADLDYSSELSELTRLQILETATVAVSTQANLSLKLVIKLISST